MADPQAVKGVEASKKKKNNRRRRNKKDVVLDFSKKGEDGQAEELSAKEFYKKAAAGKKRLGRNKISLTTNSKDYDGSLGLPEQVTQREFETTGQFFKRIDRLLAKAKVEANLEARFDMKLPREKKPNNFADRDDA